MNPRVGVVTQARTGSTRLPGKVLIDVGGRTLLEHHLERLRTSELPIYVATTLNEADDPIADIARRLGICVHRGSEHDVLGRFHGCAEAYGLDVIVRVTSDCPLIDGHLVADAVRRFVAARDDWLYLSNGLVRTYPRGLDVEVFSADALAYAHRHATEQAHREHVTAYLYANESGRMTLQPLRWHEDRSGYRITLDTPDDLEVIRRLIEDHAAQKLDCAGLIELLDAHPEITSLNAHVKQKQPRAAGE